MTVYTDQIWNKSNCRALERSAIIEIRRHGGYPYLIDAVSVQKQYRRLVTDNITTIDHIALYPEFWGTFSYQSDYINRAPTQVFNCFMNRVCMTRQSWFYQFVRRDLLKYGSISFLLDARSPPRGLQLYENNFQGNEIFAAEHEVMRSSVPFCNFDGDLDQVIVDTQISLVIETYFDWPNTIAFSEKIFRALQLPRPFMLFAAPGSVAALKKYGFDVWDDVVDHNYDIEPHPIARQVKILDQLCAWKDRKFNMDLLAMEQRAQHNRALLAQFRTAWPNRLKTALNLLQ